MSKFVPLDQAAKMLNLPPEQLVEKRANGDIHGYRDGSSWKFRMEEIERFAEEAGLTVTPITESDDDLSLQPSADDDLGLGAESDLGLSDPMSSDVLSGLELDEGGSTNPGDKAAADSDIGLIPTDSGPTDSPAPSSSNIFADSDGDLDLSADNSSGTGELAVDGSDFGLGDDGLDLASDDDLALGDDDELVLSGSSSDVTLGSDTGINLTSPSDSGLSLLDEPLDLGSSVSSLELPEDDEIVAIDDDLQVEEEFQLEPSAGSGTDDDDGSGSQVIPLDESSFESSGNDMFGVEEPLLMEDTSGTGAGPDLTKPGDPGDSPLDGLGGLGDGGSLGLGPTGGPGAGPGTGPGTGPGPTGPTPIPTDPYADYTALNVLALFTIVAFLVIGGILMSDLMLNMWSWSGTTSVSTTLMDTVLNTIGFDK